MENQETSYKLIGALLLGAVIGAGLGILFAPDKGSETRKKLLAKSGGLGDALKEKFNNLLSEVKTEVETAESKTNQLMENMAAKAGKFKIS